MKNFEKHGVGKLLCFNQSYYEGKYENDKRSGDNCKWYDHEGQTYYFGSFENNKKHGLGKVYDGRQNDVYEGEFQNDKRQGDGVLYKPDGKATKSITEVTPNFMVKKDYLVGSSLCSTTILMKC